MVTAGAPVTSVTGGDITSLGAYIANLLAQLRTSSLESGGYFDLAAAGGMNGLAPTLAREQLDAVRLQAEREYLLDLQRFGLDYAKTAFDQKIAQGSQQLQKLALQTQLQGPGDWLRYNYVENNAPGAPEATVRDTGQGINPPNPTVGAGGGGGGGGGAGGPMLALTPEQRAQQMAAEWNRTHPNDNMRPEAQLGAAGLRGNTGVQHWDPQRGWIFTPDKASQGGYTFDQQSQRWNQDAQASAPQDYEPSVSGLQSQDWTPSSTAADGTQSAGGHTWDPDAVYAPGEVPMLAFGGRSASSDGMHKAVIGDPQRANQANPELAMSRAPIFAIPLKGNPKAQRMAKGAPKFATGGIVAGDGGSSQLFDTSGLGLGAAAGSRNPADAPFVKKLQGGGTPFGQRGESLGPYGSQPFNYTNFLRLLPSEQQMTQGYIDTPTELGGLGGWFADELERSRRSGFQGASTGVSTYG